MMQINEYHKRIQLRDRLTWNLILILFSTINKRKQNQYNL